MAAPLFEDWEKVRPPNEFISDVLNGTFKYLDDVNADGIGNGVFDIPNDRWNIKPRLLDTQNNFQWFIDIDITWKPASSHDSRYFALTPCLMLLDVRDKNLERDEYTNFFTLGGNVNGTPTDETRDAMIDEDFHGYFCTLTIHSLMDGVDDEHSMIAKVLHDVIYHKANLPVTDDFMTMYDAAAKHFPMSIEKFDELFGEEVNKRMMVYHALS